VTGQEGHIFDMLYLTFGTSFLNDSINLTSPLIFLFLFLLSLLLLPRLHLLSHHLQLTLSFTPILKLISSTIIPTIDSLFFPQN